MSNVRVYDFAPEEKEYTDLEVWADGKRVPLYEARVSKYPINRRWPGYQRSKEQTEIASFALLGADGGFELAVKSDRDIEKVTVRPLSRGVAAVWKDGVISIRIPGAGFYTVEINDHHRALHLFVDEGAEAVMAPTGKNVIYYGPGHHDVGYIELKENQTLYIDEGAVVFARVFARDANGIKILGRGILDGSRNVEKILRPVGEKEIAERNKGFAVSNAERKHTVQIEFCDNVLIDGITIRDSLVYNIRPVGCRSFTVKNVKIIGNWRYNSDGIDMHNCEDVLISKCFVRTYDDAICVKGFDYTQDLSDMFHNGIMYDVFKNVLVEKCVIWCDWGRALEIGAETKAREICDVVFRDCDVIRDVGGVALDVQNVDYADVHHVTFEDIRVEYDDVCQPPIIQKTEEDRFDDVARGEYMPALLGVHVLYIEEYSGEGGKRGKNRFIKFKNIRVTAPRMPESHFRGYDTESGCENISVEGILLNGRRLENETEAKLLRNEYCSEISFA
ncbi:MAG: right-handed parallel beta-helix repeat-containing protein [Clostridia bacterium]|nr:right-handed parallel beta-helix repeat-containing protein [Clostridia bacterium]